MSRAFVRTFGVKLFVAHDRDELARQIEALQSAGLHAELVDLVPGPDSAFYKYTVHMNRAGEPVGELTIRVLRKSPPFYGIARVAQLADTPAIREPTLALLRHIGWSGVASAEYKRDSRDGLFRLMEINGRCPQVHGLAHRAGINYPALAWREAVLDERISAVSNDWDGSWVHLLDDLYHGMLDGRREGLSLRDYLAPYRRSRVHAVWETRDPKPFVALLAAKAKKAIAMLVSSRARRRLRVPVVGHLGPRP